MALTKVSAGVLNTDDIFGFRNRVINGDMRIDQRNEGTAVNSNSNVNPYVLDRWRSVSASDSNTFSVRRSTDAPTSGGFINSLLVTSLAATTLSGTNYHAIRQPIEAINFYDLMWGTSAASNATLSFWVKSSLTGNFGGSLGSNATNGRSHPFTYSINSANTWEYKTIIIPGDTSGPYLTGSQTAVNLWFSLNAGASRKATAGVWNTNADFSTSSTGSVDITATNGATWQITGVQLEKGSVATPFERRPYNMELQLCQRYGQIITGSMGTVRIAGASGSIWSVGSLCVPMRSSGGSFTFLSSSVNADSGQAGFSGSSASLAEGFIQNYGSSLGFNTYRISLGASWSGSLPGATTPMMVGYNIFVSTEL